MKKTKMKKGLSAIIVSLLLLVCGIFTINSVGLNAAYASTFDSKDGVYEFHPTIETFTYGLDDQFPISFIIESESPATSVSFKTKGFIVIQLPTLSQGSVNAQLKYDGITNNPKFTVYANLTNGKKLQASIFGIIENDTLYINGNSYEGAKDVYFSEMLESEEITQREYEILVNANRRGFVEITSTTPQIITLSSTSGLVKGTLQWEDDSGNLHPLQYTKVSIYDWDPILDYKMC